MGGISLTLEKQLRSSHPTVVPLLPRGWRVAPGALDPLGLPPFGAATATGVDVAGSPASKCLDNPAQ